MHKKLSLDLLSRQTEKLHDRLNAMSRTVCDPSQLSADLLPTVFVELGVAAEELQVALEELTYQSEQSVFSDDRTEALFYKALFELAPEGYIITDSFGIIQSINSTAATLLNRQSIFLIGKPLVNLVPLEERRVFRQVLAAITQVPISQKQVKLTVQIERYQAEIIHANFAIDVIQDPLQDAVMLRWQICESADRESASAANGPASPPLPLSTVSLPTGPSPTAPLPAASASLLQQHRASQLYEKTELISLDPQMLYLVNQGIVKLTTLSETAKEIWVGIATESTIFGSSLTCLHSYEAIALTDVEIVPILLSELTQSPQLAQAILPLMQQRLQQTERFLAIYGQHHAEDRLHQLLLTLQREIGQPQPEGTRLPIRLTHQELAEACCTTRTTISRLLGKLHRQNKLAIDAALHLILQL